jgi:hypothetical protein
MLNVECMCLKIIIKNKQFYFYSETFLLLLYSVNSLASHADLELELGESRM